MVLADTDLDVTDVPDCCRAHWADMQTGAWSIHVNIGDTMFCPDCERELVLDTDGVWRWAGE